MSDDTAVIERLHALAAAAAPTAVASDRLAAEVLSRQRTTRRRRTRRSFAGSVTGLIAVAAAVGATQLGHRPFVLQYEPSQAMAPTVAEGESVLVGRSLHAERGDVVAYLFPGGGTTVIGRVVAVGGDRVSCPASAAGSCQHVVLNGVALDETYVGPEQPFAEQTVPAGDVFLLGDNRDLAYDSRALGPIDASSITGVAVRIVAVDGTRRTIPGAPARPAPGDTEIGDPAPLPTSAVAPVG